MSGRNGLAANNERATNAALEEQIDGRGHRRGGGHEDPQVWFGLDEAGHRNARNIRDLARAIRRRDFAEADMCLDLIGRDDRRFQEEVALGRQSA